MKSFLTAFAFSAFLIGGLAGTACGQSGVPPVVRQMSDEIRVLKAELESVREELAILREVSKSVQAETDTLRAAMAERVARAGAIPPAGRAPVRWHSCEPKSLVGSIKTAGLHQAQLPDTVPPGATEILLHAYWENGTVKFNRKITIVTETRERGQAFSGHLSVHPYPNTNALSFANANFWLPVTADRKIYVKMPASIANGHFSVSLVGWR